MTSAQQPLQPESTERCSALDILAALERCVADFVETSDAFALPTCKMEWVELWERFVNGLDPEEAYNIDAIEAFGKCAHRWSMSHVSLSTEHVIGNAHLKELMQKASCLAVLGYGAQEACINYTFDKIINGISVVGKRIVVTKDYVMSNDEAIAVDTLVKRHGYVIIS